MLFKSLFASLVMMMVTIDYGDEDSDDDDDDVEKEIFTSISFSDATPTTAGYCTRNMSLLRLGSPFITIHEIKNYDGSDDEKVWTARSCL